MEEGKTYLFMDDDIYSPDPQTNTRGVEVKIDKKRGDEVWFTVIETGKKGYVVYPHLFSENTAKNKNDINTFKRKYEDSKRIHREAFDTLEAIPRAKLSKDLN